MGGNVKRVPILGGLKISRNLQSKWRRVQESWNRKELGFVKKGRGKKRGSGKDVTGTEEKAEVEAEVDTARGDVEATNDEEQCEPVAEVGSVIVQCY